MTAVGVVLAGGEREAREGEPRTWLAEEGGVKGLIEGDGFALEADGANRGR